MRQSREELKKEARPERVPVFEANRNKLTVKGLDHENFVYRWVNDRESRLADFLAGGYEFVENKGQEVGDGGVDNSQGTSSRVQKGVGGGVISYLMRIPKELWLEDQSKKEAQLAEAEADMKKSAEHEFKGRIAVNQGKSSGPFSAQ